MMNRESGEREKGEEVKGARVRERGKILWDRGWQMKGKAQDEYKRG